MNDTNQNNQEGNDKSKLKSLESELESISQKAGTESTEKSGQLQGVQNENQPTTQTNPAAINQQPAKTSEQPQPVSQVPTQALEKKSPQGKILKISLLILFVTVFIAGLFALKDILFKKKIEPEPTPSPVPTQIPVDITESWLDYKDENYFYEFKYPSDWSVLLASEEDEGRVSTFLGTGDNGEEVKLEVGKHEYNLERSETLEEFDKRVTTEATPSALKRTKEVIEGRLNVYKQIIILSEEDESWTSGIYYLFNEDNDVYFALAYTNNPNEDEPFFDKMVSTFRYKVEQKVECPEQRPEVCTEECLVGPPYICGSDKKSYCTTCKACSNEEVDFYTIQYESCEGE